MIVCVIFTNVCSLDSVAQQWQTCLDCSFQLHCFKTILLLVSVSLIPEQCNDAELSILLYSACALPDLSMLRVTKASGFEVIALTQSTW